MSEEQQIRGLKGNSQSLGSQGTFCLCSSQWQEVYNMFDRDGQFSFEMEATTRHN